MQRERCAQAARKSLFGRRPRYRHAPGSLALREIRKYQKSTDTLIPKATFSRLTRQLTLEIKPGHRWTKTAVDALQQAAEAFVVGVLEEANLCAIHGKRVTIMDRDIALTLRLRLKHTIPQ